MREQLLFDAHDAEVSKIEFANMKDVIISTKLPNGNINLINIVDCIFIKFTSNHMQNVLDSIHLSDFDPDVDLSHFFNEFNIDLNEENLQVTINNIKNGEFKYVYSNPITGGHFIAIGREIKFC